MRRQVAGRNRRRYQPFELPAYRAALSACAAGARRRGVIVGQPPPAAGHPRLQNPTIRCICQQHNVGSFDADDACSGTARLAARWLGSSDGVADRAGDSSRFFSATAYGYRGTCREAAAAMVEFDGILARHRPRPVTSAHSVPSRAYDVPPDGGLAVAGRSDRRASSR